MVDDRLREALARLVKNALTDEVLEDADTAARRAAIHEGTHWLDAFRDGIADQLDGPLAEAWERSVGAAAEQGFVGGRSQRRWEGDVRDEARLDALRALEEPGESAAAADDRRAGDDPEPNPGGEVP